MGISFNTIKTAANYVLKSAGNKTIKKELTLIPDSELERLAQRSHITPPLKVDTVTIEKTAEKAVKSKYELQLEAQKTIDDILKNKVEQNPEYKDFLNKRMEIDKEYWDSLPAEEAEKEIAELKNSTFRQYLRNHGKEIKLSPEEEKLINDFNKEHKIYYYGNPEKKSPVRVYSDITKELSKEREQIENNFIKSFIYEIKDNETKKELIKYFKNTALKNCTNEELEEIERIIEGYSHEAFNLKEYTAFLKSDFSEMKSRNLDGIKSVLGLKKPDTNLERKLDEAFRWCSPQDFAKRKANLLARYQNLDISDSNFLTLLKMSEKDYKTYTEIKDYIPKNYIINNIETVEKLVKSNKEIAKTVLSSGYSEHEFAKIPELYDKNPKLIESLLSKRYSIESMKEFLKLYDKHPTLIQNYINQGRDIKSLGEILESMGINPELTQKLLEQQKKGFTNKAINIFEESEINKIVKFCQKDKELSEAIIAKDSMFPTELRFDSSKLKSILEYAQQDEKHLKLTKRLILEKKGGSYRFSSSDITDIQKEYDKSPQIFDKLLNEMKDGDFRFEGRDIMKIVSLLNKDEKLVKELMNKYGDKFSPSEISALFPLYQKNPKLAQELMNKYGDKFSPSDIFRLFPVYQKNPKLVNQLINMKNYDNSNNRFKVIDIEDIYKALETDKEFTLKLLRKTAYGPLEKISYAYDANNIKKLTQLRKTETGKKIIDKLVNMTVKDKNGKTIQLINNENLSKILKDFDKNPEFIKALTSDERYKAFLASYTDEKTITILKDKKLLRTILPHIENSTTKIIYPETFVPNTKIIQATDNIGEKVITVKYFPNKKEYKIIKEERITKNNGIKTETVKEGDSFAHKKYEYTTSRPYEPIHSEISSRVNIKDKSVVTDISTPSKVVHGEYDVTRYTRVGTKDAKKEVLASSRAFGKNGKKTVKHFTASDGTVTSVVRIEGEKGFGIKYQIKAKNGKVLASNERHFTKAGENHFRSYLNGVRYDIKYQGDNIIVTKMGTPPETITLSSDIFDPALKELYKQLPGDYFFKIKKAGLKKITLDDAKDNACYEFNTLKIKIGELLKDNPFVFAHELGHALDYTILRKLNGDPKLIEIYRQEMEAFHKTKSFMEGDIIGYFTQKYNKGKHYIAPTRRKWNENSGLAETIAESHAIISGLENGNNFLGMRAVTLQEHFPRTIAYIMNRIS